MYIRNNMRPEKLKEFLEKKLEPYCAISNWERFFQDNVGIEGFDADWERLYDYRNHVAHSRRLRKADYLDATHIIDKLKPALEKALSDDVDNIKVSEEDVAVIRQSAQELFAPIDYLDNTALYFGLAQDLVKRYGPSYFGMIQNGEDFVSSTINLGAVTEKQSEDDEIKKAQKLAEEVVRKEDKKN